MTRTAMSSLESARRKFFMNSTHIMSHETFLPQEAEISLTDIGINRFSAQEAEISSLESARRKFFMNWTNIMSRK